MYLDHLISFYPIPTFRILTSCSPRPTALLCVSSSHTCWPFPPSYALLFLSPPPLPLLRTPGFLCHFPVSSSFWLVPTRVYECIVPCMYNNVCNVECGLQLWNKVDTYLLTLWLLSPSFYSITPLSYSRLLYSLHGHFLHLPLQFLLFPLLPVPPSTHLLPFLLLPLLNLFLLFSPYFLVHSLA